MEKELDVSTKQNKIEITGKIYPLACWKRLLSMYLTFFLILFSLALTFNPMSLLDDFPALTAYKLPIIVIVSLLVLVLRFRLGASGAFEVSFDGDLVFSKLRSGKLPSAKEIIAEVKRRE